MKLCHDCEIVHWVAECSQADFAIVFTLPLGWGEYRLIWPTACRECGISEGFRGGMGDFFGGRGVAINLLVMQNIVHKWCFHWHLCWEKWVLNIWNFFFFLFGKSAYGWSDLMLSTACHLFTREHIVYIIIMVIWVCMSKKDCTNEDVH